jgi:hypothetical protein
MKLQEVIHLMNEITLPKSCRQKALSINLDPGYYGNMAEIGAGQEVARHFFQAGAASQTIAKSISAYDKTYSDCIYGKEPSGRYVSKERLLKMLDREYSQLVDRLDSERGKTSQFFSYANTVTTINYQGNNEAHGWMGIRFQNGFQSPVNDVILHIRMLDNDGLQQQEAVGVVGVNLIHAALTNQTNMDQFVTSLMDNLSLHRMELDMIEVSGPAFYMFDNRILNLELLKHNFTEAVLFDVSGNAILPADVLYKQNIIVTRGSYRPPTLVNVDVIDKGMDAYCEEHSVKRKDVTHICEITMSNLKETNLDYEDFLARVDLLSSLNQKVLISKYAQYYKLSTYLKRFNRNKPIGLVLGAYNFSQIFEESYHGKERVMTESLGLLFQKDINVYVYPYKEKEGEEIVTLDSLDIQDEVKGVMKYLRKTDQVRPVENYNKDNLHIYSRKILNMITSGEKGWEKMVPNEVAKAINDKCLFGNITCSVDPNGKA